MLTRFAHLGWIPSLLTLLAPQASVQPNQDVAVYEAALARTVRPEVDRSSSGAGLQTPAPIVAVDTTLIMCGPRDDRSQDIGCVFPEHVERFEGRSPRTRTVMFEGQLTAASRAELGRSFRERNLERHAFPGATLDGLIPVSPEQRHEELARASGRTRGFASLSAPAYSSDGHALVYVSYWCGNLCGYGWFVLLERQDESWRVLDVVMLWVS